MTHRRRREEGSGDYVSMGGVIDISRISQPQGPYKIAPLCRSTGRLCRPIGRFWSVPFPLQKHHPALNCSKKTKKSDQKHIILRENGHYKTTPFCRSVVPLCRLQFFPLVGGAACQKPLLSRNITGFIMHPSNPRLPRGAVMRDWLGAWNDWQYCQACDLSTETGA